MTTTVGALLAEWAVSGDIAAIQVTGLSLDSRGVRPGDLYFAYPGARADGRDHVHQAMANGAVAVAAEPGSHLDAGIPVIPIPGLRGKVGMIAERFYQHPTRRLFMIGITGTNGKTSCAHLLAQAFRNLGMSTGLIGTLGYGLIDDLQTGALTTPDPITLHRCLRSLVDAGATHACMEVSSHALSQGRVSGVEFDAAVFTNLSHDHLDYHQDMDAYADAKARLFEFPHLRFAVINKDDALGRKLIASISAPTWTYGLRDADVTADHVETEIRGIRLVLKSRGRSVPAHVHLVGRVNIQNILAVAAVLLAEGRELVAVADILQRLQPVPGRMELFHGNRQSPVVVVDYAHTPDALERALVSVREHCDGRVWCVFGCGGDRDRAKRPVMGAIAERLSDCVIVTNDNPRHEAPRDITADIVSGMRGAPKVVHDRAKAIAGAIAGAEDRDWVLVAGKGHEATQQIGDVLHRLDDREIVNRCLGAAA